MGHSTPNQPAWNAHSFFAFNYFINGHKIKDLHQFSDCFKHFSDRNGRNCRFGTEGWFRFFEIYTINSLNKKKLRLISSCSKLYLGLHNQKNTIIIMTGVLDRVNHFLNKISCFEHESLLKIFTFEMIWGMVTSLYALSPDFQINNIVRNKKQSQSENFE